MLCNHRRLKMIQILYELKYILVKPTCWHIVQISVSWKPYHTKTTQAFYNHTHPWIKRHVGLNFFFLFFLPFTKMVPPDLNALELVTENLIPAALQNG